MHKGKLNPDLYQRLSTWQINIPDLKDRKQDIEALIEHFSGEFAQKHHCRKLQISTDKLTSLMAYDWPGNILELKYKISAMSLASLLKDKTAQKTSDNKEKNQYYESFAKCNIKEAKNYFEKEYLKMQLSRFEGNISKTADFIGMSRPALHKKINDLAIGQIK